MNNPHLPVITPLHQDATASSKTRGFSTDEMWVSSSETAEDLFIARLITGVFCCFLRINPENAGHLETTCFRRTSSPPFWPGDSFPPGGVGVCPCVNPRDAHCVPVPNIFRSPSESYPRPTRRSDGPINRISSRIAQFFP